MPSIDTEPVLIVRPYQLLCLMCALGDEEHVPGEPALSRIREAIRQDPGLPMALCCHSDDQFAYQSPGRADDTPEGADFNQKRDMEILLRLDLTPGTVLPANIALARLHQTITSVDGICGFGAVTSPAWQGCRFAGTDRYARGHARGISALLPARTAEEMPQEKAASLAAMLAAEAVRIRPHILMCAVAQYGAGIRPPYAEDNLPELLQHLLQHPETPITLVPGADWMMCAPCPYRCAGRNACAIGRVRSGGLYNEMKDLNVLQATGLTFGATVPARELFALIFARVARTAGVCALTHEIPALSCWRDSCGANPAPCPDYEKGRAELMQAMGFGGVGSW
ncbi:MAG: hypothetical protein ACYDCO_15895 [Armatimonadota bacterium]